MISFHETCLEYFKRRLSEGWKCISLDGYKAVLLSPEGIRRELDLRNDIATLRPNADGNYTQWEIGGETPAPTRWQSVDEAIADDLTTYIIDSETQGDKNSFLFEDLSLPGATINFVQVVAKLMRAVANHQIGIFYREDATDYDNATTQIPTASPNFTAYSLAQWKYTENPATSSAWTPSEIDAMEWGVIFSVDAGPGSVYCTQMYIEVDYSPAAGLENKSAGMGAKMIAGKLI